MRYVILMMWGLLSVLTSFAQCPNAWVNGIGAPPNGATAQARLSVNYSYGKIYCSSQMAGADSLVSGNIEMNADPTMIFPEVQYIWAMDTLGNTEWIRSFGAASFLNNESCMTTDQLGNAYLMMAFYTDLYLPDTILSPDNGNCMVTKFDSEGDRIWTKQFEGSVIPRSVWCNNKLSFAIAYSNEIEFSGSVYTSDGELDFLLVWMNSNGQVELVKEIKGNGQSTVFDLSCIGSDLLVQGKFDRILDYSGNTIGASSETQYRSYQLFLDMDGDQIWNSISSFHDLGTAVIQESADLMDDRIISVGQFGTSQVTFGSHSISNSGGVDGFLANQNLSDGSYNWLKQFGSGGNDYLMSIHQYDDHLALSGQYSSSEINFEGGLFENQYENVRQPVLFLVDTSGKYVCSKPIVESEEAGGISEMVISGNSIYAGIDYESERPLDDVTTTLLGQRNLGVWKTCLPCDTVTGITETTPTQPFLTLTPNPATTTVQINLSNLQPKSITVTDMLGRAVQPPTTKAGNSSIIDVSQLPTGMYVVTVTTENGGQAAQKLLVE